MRNVEQFQINSCPVIFYEVSVMPGPHKASHVHTSILLTHVQDSYMHIFFKTMRVHHLLLVNFFLFYFFFSLRDRRLRTVFVALSSRSHEFYLKYLLKKQGKEGWRRLRRSSVRYHLISCSQGLCLTKTLKRTLVM